MFPTRFLIRKSNIGSRRRIGLQTFWLICYELKQLTWRFLFLFLSIISMLQVATLCWFWYIKRLFVMINDTEPSDEIVFKTIKLIGFISSHLNWLLILLYFLLLIICQIGNCSKMFCENYCFVICVYLLLFIYLFWICTYYHLVYSMHSFFTKII